MRIGIAGLGKMGGNHLNELRKDTNFKILALYDKFIQAEYEEPFFTHIEDFLAQNLDIVIIASPTNTHLELAKSLCGRVKTLLIEKPLAMNLAQMQEILDLAKKYNTQIAIGFSERFNPCIVALKELLQGEKILSINMQRYSSYPLRISDVGVMQDLSVHDLDLIAFLSGFRLKNCELIKLNVKDKTREDEAMILCKDLPFLAYAHQSWNSTQSFRKVHIITQKNFFEADLKDFKLYQNDEAINIELKSPLYAEHEALFDLAKSGKFNNLADIHAALDIQRILES